MTKSKIAAAIGLIVLLMITVTYTFLYKKIEINKVIIVQVKPQKVLGYKKIGSYNQIGPMTYKLIEYLQNTSGIYFAGAPIYVFHEDFEHCNQISDRGKAQLEMCIPIFGNTDVDEPFEIYELPAAKMAKIVHKGHYLEGKKTYQILFAWIKENGYTITGPKREAYLNDPRMTKPEDILIEFYAPIG